MNIDFSLVLLIGSAITGVIWLLDRLFLQNPRREKTTAYMQEKGIVDEELQAFINTVNEGAAPDPGAKKTPQKQQELEKAYGIYQESVPVEYAKSFFPILFAVLILRSFLFEPFQIPTGSMIPTLNVGDYIVVNKFAYGFRLPVIGTKVIDVKDPVRGDVMVFIPPHEPVYYIKRVIGLPGDHVQYIDKVVYINGEPLGQELVEFLREENVLHSTETLNGISHDIYTSPAPRFGRRGDWMQPEGMTIPQGHYFMMGDNRDNSSDSRVWGPVPEENIVGQAVAVWMHKEPGYHLPSFSQNRFIESP